MKEEDGCVFYWTCFAFDFTLKEVCNLAARINTQSHNLLKLLIFIWTVEMQGCGTWVTSWMKMDLFIHRLTYLVLQVFFVVISAIVKVIKCNFASYLYKIGSIDKFLSILYHLLHILKTILNNILKTRLKFWIR